MTADVEASSVPPELLHGRRGARMGIAWQEWVSTRHLGLLGLALVCTVASWVPVNLSPIAGLDASWRAGLAMAFEHHLAWGPSIDFTYGPLGFLTVQSLYYGSTAALSLVCIFALHLMMFALLIFWCCKSFNTPLAVLLSYVVGATVVTLMGTTDLIVVPVLLLAMMIMRYPPDRRTPAYVALLAVLAAVGLLLKFSDGIVAMALIVVIVVVQPRQRRLLTGAISVSCYVVTLLGAWLATGNSLADLPSFVGNSLGIAKGYSSAMQIEVARPDEWWYALIALVVLATVAVVSLRRAAFRQRVGGVAILVVVTWWALKEGFVRHDSGHDVLFFSVILAVVSCLPVAAARLRPNYTVSILVLVVLAWIAGGGVPQDLVAVVNDTNSLRTEATTIVDSHQRASTIEDARAALRSTYKFDPAQVAALEGHTVAIEPWESTVAWAYPTIHWDPEPVFQAYSAYTGPLDQLNSHFLSSPRAPSRIVEAPPLAVDGRDPYFESPTAWVSTVCHYVELDATVYWQVLARVRDRCGLPRLVEHVHATFGTVVRVPKAKVGEALVATFTSLPLAFGYKVSALVLKPPLDYLVTPTGKYRFVDGTASDMHILETPSSLGYSTQYTPAPITSFEIEGAGVSSGSGTFTIDFYSIRVRRSNMDR